MKLYFSFSKAAQAFQRRSREVFAIISFNGQAYFVCRSNPSAEIATMIQSINKVTIGNELRGERTNYVDREITNRLFQFMVDAEVPKNFPSKSRHAEENFIERFPNLLTKFKKAFPNQKIHKIDVFLSHSPCTEHGQRGHSHADNVGGFFLPAGCDKKLTIFLKKELYKNFCDKNLFSDNVKAQIRYNYQFDKPSEQEDKDLIKRAEPGLRSVLATFLG